MSPLSEATIPIDQVTVLADGSIEVREVTIVSRDGVEVARAYHRYSLAPGDDVTKRANRVQAIAGAVWTPALVTAYQVKQASPPDGISSSPRSRLA